MTTLALNMIVGAGDADLLLRCLTAFEAQDTFDEIVLVLTSGDEKCKEVAFQFTKQVHQFQWTNKRYPYGNFAGARNLALQNTTSDYVMWLDCDDMPSKDFHDYFTNFKQYMKYDYFTFDYVITPTATVNRERVFKRVPEIFWQFPVHEQLTIDRRVHTSAHIASVSIVHTPEKALEQSVGRNLQILENEYHKAPNNNLSFYYARELLNAGKVDKGVELLERRVMNNIGADDVLAQSAIILCKVYKECGLVDKLKTMAHIGLSYNTGYADFYLYLAEVSEFYKDIPRAINLYKLALRCKFAGGGVCIPANYSLIPALQLMRLCDDGNNLEEALYYSGIALQTISSVTKPDLLNIRKDIINRIVKGDEDGSR